VAAVAREKIFRRQTTFVQYHTSAPLAKNRILIWVVRFLALFSRKYGKQLQILNNGWYVFHLLADMFLPAIRTFCWSFWLSYSPQRIHCGGWYSMPYDH